MAAVLGVILAEKVAEMVALEPLSCFGGLTENYGLVSLIINLNTFDFPAGAATTLWSKV